MSDSKQRHRNVRRSGPSTVDIGLEYREIDASGVTMKQTGSDVVTITGSPIVYSTPYSVRDSLGEFLETMVPGCVTDILSKGVDCRLLVNHSGLPLARTTSHTLRLKDTPTALTMQADLDVRSAEANSLLVALDRGDITQMSIGMRVLRDAWSNNQQSRSVFTLADLADVSPVTYPCSPTTSVEVLRAAGAGVASYLSTPDVKVTRLLMQADAEYRSGKTISKATGKRLIAAHGALQQAGMGVSAAADHIKSLLAINGMDQGLPSDGAYGGFVSGQAPGSLPSAADGTGSRGMTIHQMYPTLESILDDESLPSSLRGDTIALWKAEERDMQRQLRQALVVSERRHVDLST